MGSADQVRRGRSAGSRRQPFDVVSNPEFLKEGAAIDDFMRPDRVVVGVASRAGPRRDGRALRALRPHRAAHPLHGPALRRADQVRRQRHAGHPHLLHERRSPRSASGSAPTWTTSGAAWARDKRIGYPFLFPGVGFGGSCFPKDVRALMTTARGSRARLRPAPRGGADQRAAEALAGREGRSSTSARCRPANASASGGSPSSPRPTTCARPRRITVIEGLLGQRRPGPGPRPGGDARWRPGIFGGRGGARARPLRRRRRRRRALPRHRVERVPPARLRARLKRTMKQPVLFDGRNVWDAGQGPRRRLHLLRHRARRPGVSGAGRAASRGSARGRSRRRRATRAGAPPPPRTTRPSRRPHVRAPRGARCAPPVSETSAAATGRRCAPGSCIRATASARSRARCRLGSAGPARARALQRRDLARRGRAGRPGG